MRSAPLEALLLALESDARLMSPRLVFDAALVDVVDGVAVYDETLAQAAVRKWTSCSAVTAAALVSQHAREAKAQLRVSAP